MRSLLVIDPQHDFCKPDGALYVPGADEDMRRLADLLDRQGEAFDRIHVTLDSHQWLHIAHPIFWEGPDGESPEPFTTVSVDDVRGGRWRTRDASLCDHGLRYVEALAQGGRYGLTIWPPHCLIGTPGHALHVEFATALRRWSESRLIPIDFVPKGGNPKTEHYSAIRADVLDPNDPATAPNERLVAALREADELVVAGEALDYCVFNTLRDLIEAAPEIAAKIVLLRDASSAIGARSAIEADSIMGRLRSVTADDYVPNV